MGRRHMPVALLKSFIFVIAEAHDSFGFALSSCPVQIGWGGVDRVAAEKTERAHLTRIERLGQILEAARFRVGSGVEHNRFSEIAESLVYRKRKQVDSEWLTM